jgi:hypothetical protein
MLDNLMPCAVYGDRATCIELRTSASEIAEGARLHPVAWYFDSTGPRGLPGPAGAPGLTGALAHCAATGSALLIPYAADLPGEQALRLVAHWLTQRGLRLFVGQMEYVWTRPDDELDLAMRRQLDAASDLAVAVALRGSMPDLDQLAMDLLRGPQPGCAVDEARALAAEREALGEVVPTEPVPSDPWPMRQATARAYARWLSGFDSQAFVAEVLNELKVRTRNGRAWTQPSVSRLIRSIADGGRSAA